MLCKRVMSWTETNDLTFCRLIVTLILNTTEKLTKS